MNPDVRTDESPPLPPRGKAPDSKTSTPGRLWTGGAILIVLIIAGLLLFLRRKDPDEVWRLAQANLQANRFDEAERLAESLSRLRSPTDADQMLRAQVAIARNQVDSAIELLGDFPQASPLLPQAMLLIGQLELRRGRLRFAERSLREAIELAPSLVQARRELIYIYGFRSQSEELDEQFRALSEMVPLSADDAFVWSLIRGVQWSPEEIVEMLSRAVREDPEDLRSRIALSDALLDLARYDDAQAILESLDPSDADARAALGRLALERGDEGALTALLAEAPEDHVELDLLRGKLGLQRREPETAIEAFRSALASRPNDREALSGLSQALNQAGKRDEASPIVTQLNQVNDLNNLLNDLGTYEGPSSPDRFVKLAEACERIGFDPQARAWYQNAIGLDPFHARAQEGLARLGREEGPHDPASNAEG